MPFDLNQFADIPAYSPILSGANVVCVIGSTGTGKTTAIASLAGKLCSDAKSSERLKRITLLSLDIYHLGGNQKLKMIGLISDIPCFCPSDCEELITAYQQYKAATDLFFLDTPGISPNDTGRLNDLRDTLKKFAERTNARLSVLLAVPAQTDTLHATHILEAFADFQYDAVIVTKIDECVSAEELATVLKLKNSSLSLITNGENISGNFTAFYADRNLFGGTRLPL